MNLFDGINFNIMRYIYSCVADPVHFFPDPDPADPKKDRVRPDPDRI